MFGHRATEMASDPLLEQRIREDGTCHAVPILHVAPPPRGDAPLLKGSTSVLAPVEHKLRALGCFLRRQCLATADHRRADFAARDHFEQPIYAPLWHVPAWVRVNEPRCRAIAHAIGNRLWWVLRPPKGTLEAPACIREGAKHDNRIESLKESLAPMSILGRLPGRRSRQIQCIEGPGGIRLVLRDLPTSDKYRDVPIVQ